MKVIFRWVQNRHHEPVFLSVYTVRFYPCILFANRYFFSDRCFFRDVYRENYVTISFHGEWDVIAMTVFEPNGISIWFKGRMNSVWTQTFLPIWSFTLKSIIMVQEIGINFFFQSLENLTRNQHSCFRLLWNGMLYRMKLNVRTLPGNWGNITSITTKSVF